MSRCKRCGVLIDFDDEVEVEAFEEYGKCPACSDDDAKTLEEIDDEVRSKWMNDNDEGMHGVW
jgi:hypothetical protein